MKVRKGRKAIRAHIFPRGMVIPVNHQDGFLAKFKAWLRDCIKRVK